MVKYILALMLLASCLKPCKRWVKQDSWCGGVPYCMMYQEISGVWQCSMWTRSAEYPCKVDVCVEYEK